MIEIVLKIKELILVDIKWDYNLDMRIII